MRRFAPPAIAAVFILAACSGGSDDVAASVNGQEITVGEVEALIADGNEITSPIFAQSLGTLVQWTIAEQAAADDFGFSPTQAEVDDEVEAIVHQAGAASVGELAEAQGISEDILEKYVRQLLTQEAVTEQLRSSLTTPTDDEIATELTENAATWTEVCVSHALVESIEEAEAALERIESGEDFAVVATEVSIDPGSAANGGDLGCGSPADVGPFAEATMVAPIGEFYGPVESEFGFHIVVVASRTEPSPETIRRSLIDQALFEAADDWFNTAVTAAVVEVGEEFGTWTTVPIPQIVPA